MACGLPVITSDVGASMDMVENCGGIVVPIHNIEKMQQALDYMQDEEVRRAMSEWNINKVRHCYEYNHVLGNLFRIYEDVV